MPNCWIIFTLFVAQLLLASDLPSPKSLTFEIAIRPESEMNHVIVDAFKGSLKKQSTEFIASYYPIRRGIQELKTGRVDGSIGRIGDLNKFLGVDGYLQINFPILELTSSIWCTPNARTKTKHLRFANRLGSILSILINRQLDPERVQVTQLDNYQNIIQMMKTDRLDCFMANEHLMETEGISLKSLAEFDRQDLITNRIYPWIASKFAYLKPVIESNLRAYPFPSEFRHKFQNKRAACDGEFEVLCPDGIIFKKRIDLRETLFTAGLNVSCETW